jgi:hypothetical protein
MAAKGFERYTRLKDLNTTHPRFWAELRGFWVAKQSVHFKGLM